MGVIRRRLWLIAVLVVVAVGAVYLVGQPSAPSDVTHTSSATLTVGPRETPASVLLYAFVARETPAITTLVAADFAPEFTTEEIEAAVTVAEAPDIGTLALEARSLPDEATANAVLTSYAGHLIDYASEERVIERDESLASLSDQQAALEATINELQDQLGFLRSQQTQRDRQLGVPLDPIRETQLSASLASLSSVLTQIDELTSLSEEALSPLRIVGAPTARPDQVQTDPIGFRLRMVVAIGLAVMLGLGLAVGLHRFDSRIFNRRDAEAAFDLPVIAEVPRTSRRKRRADPVAVRSSPYSSAAEAFRLMRSNITLKGERMLHESGSAPDRGTVIMVVSAGAGAGKSTTAINLAAAMADADRSVLLVDADLRTPALAELLAITAQPGLVDIIRDAQESAGIVDLDGVVSETRLAGVRGLPHGRAGRNPGETLAKIGPVIDEAIRSFDVVIIDTPPMLVGNDVNELMAFADLVVVCAKAGLTTIDEAQWANETLDRLDAPAIGVALLAARPALQRKVVLQRTGWFGRLLRRGSTPEADTSLALQPAPVAGELQTVPQDGSDDDLHNDDLHNDDDGPPSPLRSAILELRADRALYADRDDGIDDETDMPASSETDTAQRLNG